MTRNQMDGIAKAVDAFERSITSLGPDVCFQCSVSTTDPEDPALTDWGCGSREFPMQALKELIAAVLMRIAKANRWTQDDVAREMALLSIGIYRATFMPGEDASPEEQASLEQEGARKICEILAT